MVTVVLEIKNPEGLDRGDTLNNHFHKKRLIYMQHGFDKAIKCG